MKYIKYLAIALVAVTMVACGEDEPKSTFTRDFNMIYPQFASGHKMISKIEQISDKASIVATASYDGDHLKSVNVVTDYGKDGKKDNEETIHFDYTNGAIICDKSMQDVTYSFEINSLGAITRLKNVSTERTAAALQYDSHNELEIAQTTTPSTSDVTKVTWLNGNLMQWESTKATMRDSVVYEYGTGAPLNKGGIDVVGNESFTFTKFVCAIMRNAGLFGATSTYLPTVIKIGNDTQVDETTSGGSIILKRYDITYEFDADGYVTSYTTTEVPRYTVKITYR